MRASTLVLIAAAVLTGCPQPAQPPEPPPPAPEVVRFTASPSAVKAGETTTLTWETKDATSVSIIQVGTGEVSGVSGSSGSVDVSVQDDVLFVLTARNDRGVEDSAAASAQVDEPAEGVLFLASPAIVDPGSPATLAWNAPGAKSVALATTTGEAIELGGQLEVGALTISPPLSTTYVLTVDGVAHESTVLVRPAVGAFTATPSSAKPGQPVTVTWQTSGAAEVDLSLGGYGVLHTETDAAKVADGAFTFNVPAAIDPAAALTFTLTARGPLAQVSTERELVVYVAGAPKVRKWIVPAYARMGGTFEVSWETSGAEVVEILRDGVVVFRSQTLQQADLGSVTFSSPAVETTYLLRALDLRGGVAESAPAIVDPVSAPTVSTFTASPQPGIQNGGEPVTLSWNVPFARNLRIIAEGQYVVTEVTGKAAETGTVTAYPNKDTTYRLEADNGVGDQTSDTELVTVATPAQLVFNPPTAPAGGTVTVTAPSLPNASELEFVTLRKNVPGTGFVDISTTGIDIDYCNGCSLTSEEVTLPQTFNTILFGEPISTSEISVSINGWFAFAASTVSVDSPTPLPTTALEPFAIAPFFEDLKDTDASEIFVQLDTVGSEQRLIVQWQSVKFDPVTDSELTFQAQIYEKGRVVFAYQSMQDAADATPAIGIQDGAEAAAVTVPSGIPADGDTYMLLSGFAGSVRGALPYTTVIRSSDVVARVYFSTGGFIEIEQTFPIIPPNQFRITEVNLNPAVPGGQWIEVSNNTANAIDLNAWVLSDGQGGSHTISQPVILPPNGSVVLAQSANAADGVTVDYVWGSSFTLPSVIDSEISIGIAGGLYSGMRVPANVVPGYSLQVGPVTTSSILLTYGGITELLCTAQNSSTYGSSGQRGTPGAPNTPCPGYSYAGISLPGSFESIALTGTPIVPGGGVNESIDEVQLTVPVRFGAYTFDKLWVSTNGWVSFRPIACSSSLNCHYSNNTSINPANVDSGVVAPFWDDLNVNPGGGMYWERKVPGLAPNDGYTIVSWENVRYDSTITSAFNFQVKFFDSGNIEFHFGTMTTTSSTNYARGASATTWLEDPTGYVAWEINTSSSTAPGIEPASAYRFIAQ